MKHKARKIKSTLVFSTRKNRVKKIHLYSGLVVERTLIGGVKKIHVSPSERTEVLKRPSFSISKPFLKLVGIWKRN